MLFLVLLPYFIWQNNNYGTPLAFFAGSHVTSDPSGITSYKPIGWHVLNFLPWMLHTPFFILFFLGIITLYSLVLSFDLILKNKSNENYNDLFIFLPSSIASFSVIFDLDAISFKMLN